MCCVTWPEGRGKAERASGDAHSVELSYIFVIGQEIFNMFGILRWNLKK